MVGLKQWIRSILYKWLKPEELWWSNRLPNAYEFRFDVKGKIVKDREYWGNIVKLLENKEWYQEMAETEEHYRKKIDKAMFQNDWPTVEQYRQRLFGFKRGLVVITDAQKILNEERELDGFLETIKGEREFYDS